MKMIMMSSASVPGAAVGKPITITVPGAQGGRPKTVTIATRPGGQGLLSTGATQLIAMNPQARLSTGQVK